MTMIEDRRRKNNSIITVALISIIGAALFLSLSIYVNGYVRKKECFILLLLCVAAFFLNRRHAAGNPSCKSRAFSGEQSVLKTHGNELRVELLP